MSWTEDRTTTAKKLWLEGASATAIAKLLGEGLTRNAVIGKMHRLGLGRLAEDHVINARRASRRAAAKRPRPRPRPVASAPAVELTVNGAGQKIYVAPPSAKGLLQLGSNACKFPVGEATGADQLFCAASCEGPYCYPHMDIAWRPNSEARS